MEIIKEEIPEDIIYEASYSSQPENPLNKSIANLLNDEEKRYFISEVKKRPELWSIRNPDHANRIKRRASWEEVAVMFSTPERILSGSDMLNAYKNFKDTTTRIFRRLRTKPGFNVHWPFFQDMEFIIDNLPDSEKVELLEKYQRLKGYQPETVPITTVKIYENDKNEENLPSTSWETSIESLIKPISEDPLTLSSVLFNEKPSRKRRNSNPLPTMVNIQSEELEEPIESSLFNQHTAHTSQQITSLVEEKRDRFDHFGALVASTMREIFNNGLQDEAFKMKREIHDIIEKYEEKFLFNHQ